MWSEETEQSSREHPSCTAERRGQEQPRTKVVGIMELKALIKETLIHIITERIQGLAGLNVSGFKISSPIQGSQTRDDLPQPQKWRCCIAEEDLQSQWETQDTKCVELYIEEDDLASSYISSSSSQSSFSSCHPPMLESPGVDFAGVGTSSLVENPHRAFPSSRAMGYIPCNQSVQVSHKQSGEGLITYQALPCIDPLPNSEVDVKINELVRYFLYKYVMKEPATMAEILSGIIIGEFEDYYDMFLDEASECLLLVFGIDVKEGVSYDYTYVIVTAMDLTYDGMLSDIQGIPKMGLLIMVLCIIFMEGSCASEEVFWRVLNKIGVLAERDHFMYGNPRKLVTENFVQEGYLEYRQVLHSDPARYEFLWGPRAHDEIGERKVLEFLTTIYGYDPRFHPMSKVYTLRDGEEMA